MNESPNYENKWVAIGTNGVIASGDTMGQVYDAAIAAGEKIPTIVFMPKQDAVWIY